jgi:hypothetical protein
MMKATLLLLTTIYGASVSACTFHAAMGGQGLLRGDAKHGGKEVATGGPILMAGGGPCLRWPRLRTSMSLEGALRGASADILVASETFWIFDEGYARDYQGDTARTSLALKGRLAGGWNSVTDRPIADFGMGIAIVIDSDQFRDFAWFGSGRSGDFNAISLDAVATYAPDISGENDVWVGGQLAFHFSGFAMPARGYDKLGSQKYGKPRPGQSTDCNSGHLP